MNRILSNLRQRALARQWQRLGRAVSAPWGWTAAYWMIIGVEGLTCTAFTVAAVALARALRADAADFARAKRFVSQPAGASTGTG